MARWTEAQLEVLTGKKLPKDKKKIAIAGGYRSNIQGWFTIGGKKHYFKSLWEINYTHYLEWLLQRCEIKDWQYEPETFAFPKEAYKAGPFYYKPDFKVTALDTVHSWHEVKGVLNTASKKKIKRFEKHHPQEGKIIIVGSDWFKQANKSIGPLVPGWTTVAALKEHQRLENLSLG